MLLNVYNASHNDRSSATFLVSTNSDLRLHTETYRNSLNTILKCEFVCLVL